MRKQAWPRNLIFISSSFAPQTDLDSTGALPSDVWPYTRARTTGISALCRRCRAATSSRDHFLSDEVQSYQRRGLALLEMAVNGISHLPSEGRNVVGFREDGFPNRPSDVSALRPLFHVEDDLVHAQSPIAEAPAFKLALA